MTCGRGDVRVIAGLRLMVERKIVCEVWYVGTETESVMSRMPCGGEAKAKGER